MGAGESQTLRLAVLGLIVPRPIHAYGILQELRRWPLELDNAKAGVFYATAKLMERGLVQDVSAAAVAVAAGAEAAGASYEPPRRMLAATGAGRDEFERWMASPLSSEQEVLWRIGVAQRDHVPLLVELLRAAEVEWYDRLSDVPELELETLGNAWSVSTRLALMQVTRRRQLAARGALFGELARELSELDADTPRGGRR